MGFTRDEAVAVPRGQSGIYMLCASPVGHRFSTEMYANNLFDRLLTPIYIGQTTDLHKRFLHHCNNPSAKVGRAALCFGRSLMFWFHLVPSEQLIHSEAVLIHCFGPTANERVEPIPATLGTPIPIGASAN